jgi:hypothetical protein
VIVVALLGATAAAFAYTQHLKLEKSPITGTRVDKVFSPVCECVRDVAVISFVLRRAETVSLEIIDADGKPVRTVVDERREPKGRVAYTWDGRDDDGRVVADARYRPRVELERNGRTIVLPNPIRVDTTAPTIEVARVTPRVFSPDGDGNRDSVTAVYRVDEPSRATLLVDGQRRVLGRFKPRRGRLEWLGNVNGRSARPGVYELRLRAVDRAGNLSERTTAVPVRVRYIELGRDRVEAVAGERFSIFVSTDADSYRWRFAGKQGAGKRRVLRLRAPEEPGTYALYVILGDRADRAEVVVTVPETAP